VVERSGRPCRIRGFPHEPKARQAKRSLILFTLTKMLWILFVESLSGGSANLMLGTLGHRTVGLAEMYFTHDASRLAQQLSSNDKGYDISDAALFADKIRLHRPATAG
jgi:hypothetical protein